MTQPKNHTIEDVVLQHYADIYRYCYFRLHDRSTAQDLTQEVFCRFFQRAQKYSRDNSIRQLLFVIARNLCIDHYRKHTHEQEELSPEQALIQEGMRTVEKMTLYQALMRLPYVQREALLLRYYYDFKIRDIAAITNTSPSNIKYRLKQGLNTLKTILQKEGITNENWF